MSSLTLILTALQNGVQAVNGQTQLLRQIAGTNTSATVTSNTLVVTGAGRLVSYSVVVPGDAGTINDAATVATASASNALVRTPQYPGTSADSPIVPAGVFPCGLVFLNGLVIKPGSGQSINVTYSLGAI
jgi:hypothetical protein